MSRELCIEVLTFPRFDEKFFGYNVLATYDISSEKSEWENWEDFG